MSFLVWVSGVSRCIQHPPRIPSQLEMRELGTGVIPLLSLNVATTMATILLLSVRMVDFVRLVLCKRLVLRYGGSGCGGF